MFSLLDSMNRRFCSSYHCTEALRNPMNSAMQEMKDAVHAFDRAEYKELFEPEFVDVPIVNERSISMPLISGDSASMLIPTDADGSESSAAVVPSSLLSIPSAPSLHVEPTVSDGELSPSSKGQHFEAQLIQLDGGALKRFGTRCDIYISDKEIVLEFGRRAPLRFAPSAMLQGSMRRLTPRAAARRMQADET